ncbi:MAG: DEAD/DEAH box helicase [Candidatus Heimdallarchaeota archaeon]|nr:DEAD/DEAH box helicase [Candidatus Heimdallarchaeota archaeon]
MSGKAFQYYVFLMDFEEETQQMKMLLLPAKAAATRIKPLERAKIQFVLEKERLRPYKYNIQDKIGSEYKKPEEITRILKKAKGIIIPVDEKPENYPQYLEYFKTFNIQEPTFRRICRLCMIDHGRVTILLEDREFRVAGRKACYQCAKDELEREINSREIRLSNSGKRHFFKLLQKVKNVDDVMESFAYNFRPTARPDLTLFDTIGDIDDLSESKSIDQLAIPGQLKDILKKIGIKKLLPIQVKALDAGLLRNKDLLVVAGTSSGKTLIGEMAGIIKALQGKRMIYLSPLVALTNQKYEDFKKRYSPEGLRVAIRVGMSKIDVGDEAEYIIDKDYRDAQIITATYEAFDLLLRNGKASAMGEVGTVIIDEIQLLNDKERGPELDGIIIRIRELFPKAQIIGLSATIGNPEELAEDLHLHVLLHETRPVLLERHIVLSQDQDEKERHLRDLILQEYNQKSSFGYFGQSIVFTNSRRHCYELAAKLNKSGLRTAVYHSGLTFRDRKKAELGFANGKYAAIITTAALGAGVDFPASQVIFESLAMGIFWITVAEFHQMTGRAGRLGYHDKGKVALLVEPNRKYHSSMDETEDSIAFQLLSEPIEYVEPIMEGELQLEQVLACIVALKEPSLKQIARIYQKMLGPSEPLKETLQKLKELEMINIFQEGPRATSLGKATSRTFLPPSEAGEIKKKLQIISPLEIAIGLEPITSIYLNSKIHAEIEKTLKSGFIGSNLFSGSLLEYMESVLDKRANLPRLIINTFAKWQTDIFNCKCDDNPWCECGESSISRIIVKLRLENKNLRQISTDLSTLYNLYAYPGDIYRWFDTLIHHLRAVAKLALVFDERKTMKLALNTIRLIEKPWLVKKLRRLNNTHTQKN